MTKEIASKACQVVVVDSRVDTRVTVREVLKSLGFSQISLCASVNEALSFLSQNLNQPCWVISALLAPDENNALHFLVLFLREQALHQCRLSLILQAEEKYCIPRAFEMGLLSWHMLPFTQTSLKNELETLLNLLSQDNSNGCWTACGYLRTYLALLDDFPNLIQLEEKLITIFPQKIEFMIYLAEAQKLAGQNEASLKTIQRAQYLGSNISKGAQQLKDLIQAETGTTGTEISFAESFGFKTAVLIDPDSSITRTIKEILEKIGFSQIEIFEEGESAWNWIEKNGEPHVVIQEWRLTKLTGSAVLQRCRQKGFYKVPFIVVSSLVKGTDENLLRELGVAMLIEKPFGNETFTSILMFTLQQEKLPNTVRAIERKIHLALGAQNYEEAQSLRQALEQNPEAKPATKITADAAIAYYKRDYSRARTLAFEAFNHAGDSLIILNLIGKIFLKIGAYEESIKCFNKAQELSSSSLERLCLLAEAQTELGNIDSANENIEKAKKVDAENTMVKMTEAKISISNGDTKKASEIMSSLDNIGEIASYTNNRAVSLVKSGKIEESFDMYKKAEISLPKNDVQYRSVILYNLALSYARSNKLKESIEPLKKAAEISKNTALEAKISSLKSRIENSLSTGNKLELNLLNKNLDQTVLTEHQNDFLSIGFDLKPGEICAHQIFKSLTETDSRVTQLLKKVPNFFKN